MGREPNARQRETKSSQSTNHRAPMVGPQPGDIRPKLPPERLLAVVVVASQDPPSRLAVIEADQKRRDEGVFERA